VAYFGQRSENVSAKKQMQKHLSLSDLLQRIRYLQIPISIYISRFSVQPSLEQVVNRAALISRGKRVAPVVSVSTENIIADDGNFSNGRWSSITRLTFNGVTYTTWSLSTIKAELVADTSSDDLALTSQINGWIDAGYTHIQI
jgi:hypothetical protein